MSPSPSKKPTRVAPSVPQAAALHQEGVQGHDFVLQTVTDIKGSLGEMRSDVGRLIKSVDDHSAKLEKFGQQIHTARVLLSIGGVIFLGVCGWIGTELHSLINIYFQHHASVVSQSTSTASQASHPSNQ